MAKRIKFCISIFTLFATLCLGVFAVSGERQVTAFAEDYVSFYSEKNAPIFYGTTEITIDKNVTERFSILDSRFRIFAKDFEDGDLTPQIECLSSDVNPTVAGEYEVKYRVTDSNANTTEITVPVHVTDEENGVCKIVRTLYTMPSLWNMSLVGTERCNNGDSQILGVYLPGGSSADLRILDGESDVKLTFFTNTRTKNSFATIKAGQEEYITIKNTKNGVDYDSVPLITTPRLKQDNEIERTYKIEVKFDTSVKELDYYHYKDNENDFKNKWKSTENSYGIVDGEAIMVVVPFFDVDKLSNYIAPNYNFPFVSLDAFFEYYLEVVNRMDKMIGLEFDSKTALDQNFRTKCLIVADAGYGSGAYYMGTFIGISSSTVSAAFQYGWGTLHEIAHGYQGTLGRGANSKGDLCLNETGNNILAHYIQMDRNLYKKTDSYIGKLQDCENSLNNSRKTKVANGQTIFNNSNGTYTYISEKMYCIVNLLDGFEGATTYGKLFSYFRKIAYEKGINAYSIADIYAKFFADEYGVNIIPYLKSWTMTISNDTCKEIMKRALPAYSILSDSVSEENLQTIKDKTETNLNYGLVCEDTLRAENISGNLTVNIQIDEFKNLKNRNVGLFYKNKLVKVERITGLKVKFEDLQAGTYELRMPAMFGYDNNFCVATIGEGENKEEYVYNALTLKDYSPVTHNTSLRLYGVNGTLGYTIDFSESYTKGKITLGAANMGNQTNYWKGKSNDVFISVTIKDNKGRQIEKTEIKGGEYFSNKTLTNSTIDFKVGYKICVSTYRPGFVKVYSLETGKEIDDYRLSQNTSEMKEIQSASYAITKNGLKLVTDNFDETRVLYNARREKLVRVIEEYKASANDEEIETKFINIEKKTEIINIYNYLSNEDKLLYKDFVERIKKGGVLQASVEEERIVVNRKDNLDLYSLISATDTEDMIIKCDKTNTKIKTNLNLRWGGEYKVNYTVYDSDGNAVTKSITVVVIDKTKGWRILGYASLGVALLALTILIYVKVRKKRNKL